MNYLLQWGKIPIVHGALAQLGERKVRNLEARGSIPLRSTTNRKDHLQVVFSVCMMDRRA